MVTVVFEIEGGVFRNIISMVFHLHRPSFPHFVEGCLFAMEAFLVSKKLAMFGNCQRVWQFGQVGLEWGMDVTFYGEAVANMKSTSTFKGVPNGS